MSVFQQPETRAQILQAIAGHAGLQFAPERWPDVERGLQAATEELALPAVGKLIQKILPPFSDPEVLDALVRHLTVGETYFLRDPATFEILRREILIPLIHRRRASGERQLRIWSAGCCTGEETYTLAMVVAELLPDLADWRVTIIGSDINRTFLDTAEAGLYRKWSFRGTTQEFQRQHFTTLPGETSAIHPRYRQMVSFRILNLAGDAYPSPSSGLANLDVIFCRNVLIYFSAEQARRAGQRLFASLAPEGWLIASAAEPSGTFAPLVPVTFPGVIVYRKIPPVHLLASPSVAIAPPVPDHVPEKPREPLPAELDQEELVRLCRARANAGDLAEALRLSDLALLRDRLNPRLHYLRGSILQEAERVEEAGKSFRRAVHLDHGFVPAYFALGTLAGKKGRRAEQIRHFEGALEILRAAPPDQIVPESSGMTAARLAEVIETSMHSPT